MLLLISAILIFFSLGMVLYAAYPSLEQILRTWQRRRLDKITPELDRMFIDIPYRKLLLMDIGFPLAAGLLVFSLTKTPWMGLVAAFAGLAISNLILRQLEVARRAKFASQLVDGLMLLSGSLNVGLSLLQSFEALVEEMPAPISQEFGLVVRENRMGIPLEECLHKLKQRMKCEELTLIITAVLVARETGGEITKVFSSLVLSIRERNRLLSRVKALCVQGKLQGRIMMFLPILFGYAACKINPEFFNTLVNTSQGRMLLGYAVVSDIIGTILIMRMSRIEI